MLECAFPINQFSAVCLDLVRHRVKGPDEQYSFANARNHSSSETFANFDRARRELYPKSRNRISLRNVVGRQGIRKETGFSNPARKSQIAQTSFT